MTTQRELKDIERLWFFCWRTSSGELKREHAADISSNKTASIQDSVGSVNVTTFKNPAKLYGSRRRALSGHKAALDVLTVGAMSMISFLPNTGRSLKPIAERLLFWMFIGAASFFHSISKRKLQHVSLSARCPLFPS